MNEAPPFKVLIVAKTRMKRGMCVGGITDDDKSVRLEAPRGAPAEYNDPYAIGDVWEIKRWTTPPHCEPPHTEDRIVHERVWMRPSTRLLPTIERVMPPVCGGLQCLFDGMVRYDRDRRLVITRAAVPGYSTLFWRPDRDLTICAVGSDSFRYSYPAEDGPVTLSYTGLAPAEAVLPAGTLLRISLARWWRLRPEDEECCHLQVSGWYAEPSRNRLQMSVSLPVEVASRPDFEHMPSFPVAEIAAPVTPPVDLDAHLLRHFGFSEFRPYQREIIADVLAGRDVAAVMPTGGGKSLCFQLPAQLLEGLTLVVSPLISLMQDQVKHLREFGIEAAALNSHLDATTRARIMRQAETGALRVVYLAPETLVLSDTVSRLRRCRIARLVVDEAHCISRWGHDFRPEYRQIRDVRRSLGDPPVLALTATATTQVRNDIVQSLALRDPAIYVAPFDRPNLFLAVQPRNGDGLAQVLDFLARHPQQSGILYCATRAQVDELSAQLQAAGIEALPYHAGLPDDVRADNQRRFVYDEIPVMVATVAFGMGIDKPDVRFVLHVNLPQDPESYYQQIGRAGRDGDPADCLLLHGPRDYNTVRFLIDKSYQEHGDAQLKAEAEARLQHMAAYIKHRGCRRKWLVNYFDDRAVDDRCTMCDACVAPSPAARMPAAQTLVAPDGEAPPDGGVQPSPGQDLTEPARLFLDCVRQLRQSFGVTHVIDVLRASRRQAIIHYHHDRLTTYGQGQHLSKKQWQRIVAVCFQQHLLVQNEHGALLLTEQGQAVLDGAPVYGDAGERASLGYTSAFVDDPALFERLRSLRRELAQRQEVPPYVVFADRTLRDLAARKPRTLAEMETVFGIGARKLAQYGDTFLAEIAAYLQDSVSEPASPPLPQLRAGQRVANVEARRTVALAALQAGQSLQEAAAACGVQPVTVVGYVERAVRATGALPPGVRLPAPTLSAEDHARALAWFAEQGTDALGPLYRALEGRVAYLDLHLLRIHALLA